MAQKIQMRRDSVENWLDVNPILARGEWGVAFDGTSTDVIAIKIGDGESDWESLQSLLPINSSDTGGGAGSSPTVVGYIAESRLDDETGFNAYDGEGVQSVVLWADLESGVTVFVRNSGRVCTADGAGSYTTVDAPPGFYATEDGVVALMPEVGTPSILSPTGGATANRVITTYQPTNYEVASDVNSIDDHLAGIDNAIGEQFLDSVYVPTSGPLVDLATGMELEVETPEVLTLTGNTVHVRSVDQDHTGKTILVECTLVDQHDRTGRRLKGFEMVGTASNAYSLALTLNGITPLDGSAWENGHREDLGIYLGFSGKAVAELGEADGYPSSRSAQFTSPIPSNDLDDHRISIIVSTGLNPTFNGVIETEFEIVPIWEDANEVYNPAEASQWEDLTGDVPESKTEALDKLMGAVAGGSSEPFLIDGEPLDSESGFWGPLFDLFSATTGTWDNPEFPDGNSISLATPSVEQQTLGYTAKWKLNLSPLNRGQGLKGLHFSGAGVEGGDCAWLVTDASDVAVAGGEWNQGRKVDPGSGFGYPGKAIVSDPGTGSLTDMYFDNVIYPEEGELFYLQLAMSHFESPYEGVMSVDLIVTPIWQDVNEVYTPDDPAKWESLDPGDPEVPETKREGLDLLVHTVVDLLDTVAGKQAADADLTAIAALAPADDALIQRKAGAWTSRTPAQVKADMSIGVGDVSGLDENTRDVIGTALVAGSGVAVTVDDPGNTITIAVSGVVADAINDGTTTVAPSQNAVYDALALLVPKSTVTTKGDLIVGTGSGAVTRVGVGATNKQPLVVDSTQTAGVKFGFGAEASSARYVSGQYLPAAVEFISTTSWTLLANYIVAIPCYIPPGMAVDRIGVYCTTGGSGATIRVAVHRPTASGYVGTQIVAHAGTLSNAASGLKEATVSFVGEGWSWFVFQTGGASATVRAFTPPTYLWTRWGPPFVDVVASTVTPYANLQAARSDAAIPSDLSTGVSWGLDNATLGVGIYRVA